MLRLLIGLFALGIMAGADAAPLSAQDAARAGALDNLRWRYHEGDDSLWSDPAYPDDDWETVAWTSFTPSHIPERGWSGIGWFRSKFEVPDSLVGQPLTFVLSVDGAVELFLDGRLIASRGSVGTSASNEDPVVSNPNTIRPGGLMFESPGLHTLAARTSDFRLAKAHSIGRQVGGFRFFFADNSLVFDRTRAVVRRETAEQFLFTGIPAAFAVVFLLVFLFYRVEKAHLYFAVFCMLGGALVFLDLQADFALSGDAYVMIRRIMHTFISLALISAMLITYALFEQRIPKQFWLLAAVGIGIAVWAWLDPFAVFPTTSIFSLVVVAELVRSTVRAVASRRERSWIIGIGLSFLVIGVAYDALLDLGVIRAIADATNGYYYGMTMFEISMALFLATAFAETNMRLEQKLVEVKDLSQRTLEQERDLRRREIERVRLETENEKKELQLEKAQQLRESYNALEKAHQDLKATQASLIHSEKMASLGKLAAGIAHEIKNPLNFINNFASMSLEMATELKEKLLAGRASSDPESSTESVEIVDTILGNITKIAEHGKRADGVVKSMMEHSRTTPGNRRRVELNQFIDQYVRLAYRSIKSMHGDVDIHIEREFDPEVGAHDIVSETFSRALLNLLDNAFEAAMQGRGGSDHVPVVGISTTKLDNAVLIRIRDNGPGVPAEIRDRIFEPFFTTKPTGKGTGLGLSLAHEIIVEGHGGTLGLEHLDDQETGFYITLPTSPDGPDQLGADWPEQF